MSGRRSPGRDDERYLVVAGRRWRREDPMLDSDVAAALRTHLGRGRSGVAHAADEQARLLTRERMGLAKHGLGERGEPWWEMTAAARRRRAEEALAVLARLDAPDAPSIRDAILDLLSRRAERRTVCPSDVARALLTPEPDGVD